MRALDTHEPAAADRPQLEDLVPPELPPEVAVARLIALAQSLLIENHRLRELVHKSYGEDDADVLDPLHPFDRGAAA